jgi:glutaconate CoA-transferase subunit A
MPYEYYSDEKHLRQWLTVQNDPTAFTSFMKRNIYDCPDHATYIELAGGIDRIQELRARELLLHKEENHAEL